eukprot:SAG31_NODE_24429_length_481_cov_1.060209_1_plen_55_part_01
MIFSVKNAIVCSTKIWRYSPAYPQLLMIVIYTTPLLLSVVVRPPNPNTATILPPP